MNEYLTALGFALIPAGGNFFGGLLAEMIPVSKRALSLALHAAAGIVTAVVAIEIMPRAKDIKPTWAMIGAFVAGGLFFMLADALLGIVRRRMGGGSENGGGPWLIYFAVAVDLFSDGVMIGAGATIGSTLALLLALGQVGADIPEGFATMAVLRREGLKKTKRIFLSAAFALPVLLGATLGFVAVRGAGEPLKVGLLVFTAGVLTTVTVEEMMPEAHEEKDTRWATLCFVLGFAGFWALTAALG